MRIRNCLPVLVLMLLSACSPTPRLQVTDAWIRLPPSGTHVAVGYFDIRNNGDAVASLTGARCEASGSVEIHTHLHDGEMMRMRQLDRVDVAPGQVVSFAPGGHHLMLMQFADVTSSAIDVTLLFADGTELVVPFELRSVLGAPAS